MRFQLMKLNCIYNVQLVIFHSYYNIGEHLKKLILEAINSKYVVTLKDEMMWFATITPQIMLAV